jgi:SAM-dependent MidA family methyltransferase
MQYEQPISLPPPDELSALHSARVLEHLHQHIASAGGEISFAEFMYESLYAKGLGYYSAGSAKFGSNGDFVTAPEVSPVFGRVLARQCSEVLSQIEGGQVLEVGAGSGRLAVDLLTALEALDCLPPAYSILEVSADLMDRQQELLQSAVPHLLDRIHWLSGLPTEFNGVVVANEVLDALPVERFQRCDAVVQQCCVASEGGELTWIQRIAPSRLSETVAAIESDIGAVFADGYTSEISLAAPIWIADIASCLQTGVVFLFDYGVSRREYYALDRSDGWLRCHFRHHAHSDPLIYPGIQDLTAWVDFSSIAAAAVANDLDIMGYQTQAQFLMGGGLEEEMKNFTELSTAKQLELSGQIKTLTLPGEMGENFKCMALGRGDIHAPPAFHFADRTQTL